MKVAVIGAGAAGHFAAAAIARNCNAEVSIYHDPDIPGIGVGESVAWGSVGFVRDILGITDELEFMKQTQSTFKLAAVMQGFTHQNDKPYFVSYPYSGSSKILEKSALMDYRHFISHNDQYSLYDIWMYLYENGYRSKEDNRGDMNELHYYAELNKSPINEKGEYVSYGALGHSYHCDASKMGPVVYNMVGGPHGVKLIGDPVEHVDVKENKIDSLKLKSGKKVVADLYIDCTGFERLLISKLDVKFEPTDEYFNNSALVGMDFYTSHKDYTNVSVMKAMPHGWAFNVPTHNRSGNGYIFNSRFGLSVDQIVDEFESITGRKDVIKRHITWEPGYYERAMTGNCIALGMSYGFSEAFDANGFSSVMTYITRLVKHINSDEANTFDWKDDFNYYVTSIAEDIVFRIQCAMHLAPRDDTEFWKEMKVASQKFNTLEKLQDTIHSDERKKYLGFQNKMYSQHTFINTALYYDIPLNLPEMNIDKKTIDLAVNWFNFFNNKNRIMAQNSLPIGDFYKNTIYKNLKF